ncbi:MAG: asparaginase [Cocleimonas sp.]|nr:asparaginase [Cocleimonas sp.]
MNKPIRLLVTGGTLDKQYNELSGELIFAETQLPKMLKQARCHANIQIETCPMKDSLAMNDSDREHLAQVCLKASESQLVITHGTDTMTLTAAHLASQLKNKTIVLLGAMIPYPFKDSDSLFNLGSAISAVQCLPPNIYITMNGKIFRWDHVVKNRKMGCFEAINH